MPTSSHRGGCFIPLLIVLGILEIGATAFLVGLWVDVARTEQRIARSADHDYSQKQIAMVLDRRVGRGVSGKLAKLDEVGGLQMGLL